jgi:hypothetical protein
VVKVLRVLAIVAGLIGVSLVALPSSPASAATPTNAAIVAAATAYADGSTVGDGQCWTFMKEAVRTASGGTMAPGQNNDYYGSYTAVGGQLIARDDAQPGDIIQVYNPANHQDENTSSGHLHTAIILGHAAGSNTFSVIDQNFVAALKIYRHNFDPYAWKDPAWAVAIWRLGTVSGSAHNASKDFNGDGTTDLATYNPADGKWSTSSLGVLGPYGGGTQIPVPGDYNGDGKTEMASYSPDNGLWSISTLGVLGPYGGGTQIPVPGDYNGDGKVEMATYSPDNGLWSISTLGVLGPLGGGTQIPVPGDYNGDGKTDLATYSPDNGLWSTSSLGVVGPLGGGGQIPVPGDYNGDGKTDLATYNPADGKWSTSSLGVLGPYGGGTQIPVPGDYNGDGKTEMAAYSADNGLWSISTLGVLGPLGGGTQIPVPGNTSVTAWYLMRLAAPPAGTATAGNGVATVNWTRPTTPFPLTGYVVTPYVGASAQPARTFNSTATSQTITGLTNGTTYTFKVAAKNAFTTGPPSAASNAVTPDGTAPTSSLTPPPRWNLSTTVPVAWSGSDAGSGVKNFDVVRRGAAWNAQLPATSTTWLSATTAKSSSFTGSLGSTYCIKVRARDNAGNLSGYSPERCTAIPLRSDQIAYSSGTGWARASLSSAYAGFYYRTTTLGAKATRTGMVAKRIALVASRCPTCGSVKVYWNGTYQKTIALTAATTLRKQTVDLLTFAAPTTGTLTIEVSTSGKPVVIEGLAISKSGA